jgi:mannose-6-phosphate isomerase-like protein (cupin superfamily)
VEVRSLAGASPFVTADGSVIRPLLDRTNSSVAQQSLAEATIPAGEATARHYHRVLEELYYVVSGRGDMELDGEHREVGPGDAILIPPGAWHQLRADQGDEIKILCCCAPPYSHEDTYFE